jgi:FecR protein
MDPRKSITVLLASTALTALPAAAQQVGTATAVNPTSQGTMPGASLVALTVGARIVHKERIQTTPTGTVQLLFLDKSTLSIGPNSNILIDEYVFDPKSNTGHMVTTLAEGALRLVGGLLSHQGEALIGTPAAAIGIRGATVTVQHSKKGTRVINHFGIIRIHNGCGEVIIRRPGFAVWIADWNTCPGEPERVTEAEIAEFLRILTSRPWEDGGVPGFTNALLEGFGIGAVQGTIGPNTLPVPNGNGESSAFQLILQATQHATGRGAPLSPPPTSPAVSTSPPPPPPPPTSPPPTSLTVSPPTSPPPPPPPASPPTSPPPPPPFSPPPLR